MRADLHLHSRHSPDSTLEPREIVRLAKSRDLRAVAITDHNTVAGHGAMADACKTEGLLFIPGIEVTSTEGHILAYGVKSAPRDGRTAVETIEEIHALGGIASAAHPERVYTGLSVAAVRASKFDAVEVFNSQSLGRHNAQARKVAEELRLPVTGGSDAHQPYRVSLGYLAMELEPESMDAAIDQILKGHNRADGQKASMGHVFSRAFGTAGRWLVRGGKRI
jgi:predicted metal-dependent phosphoesterase TrpH